MKRVVFVIHGIGRHEEGWSKAFSTGFGTLLGALEADEDFDPEPLLQALEQTVFIEITYDDIYRRSVNVMLQRDADLIAGLRVAGLNRLATLLTTDADEAHFVRDNIFDVLVYRAMREHRAMTRKHVLQQIHRAVDEHGTDELEYSVVAHSMGTAVAHDALHEMATEPGSPLRHGLTFAIKNLVMIANTSALLRSDYDPAQSLVRPFIGPNDPGYVNYYWNFSHRYDPVAQIYSYQRYMKDHSPKRFTFATIDHVQAKNIHALTHYLNDPGVHMRLFSAVYGRSLLPDAYRDARASLVPRNSLSATVRDALVARIEADLHPVSPDPDERSAGLIVIARHLREIA